LKDGEEEASKSTYSKKNGKKDVFMTKKGREG
jgi:hypothetical protein